ncbi:MAG: HAD-IA family hydrolase [Clostridiales bacterium]|nr:HAD-IA family hydrolase [Clostridiales bacterium]
MYKYLVFDFDGTLIDSNYLIDRTIRATSENILEKEVSQEVIDSIWGKVLTEQMEELDPSRVEELCNFYSAYYREHRDEHTTIFEGILEMLEELHKTCKMGIVTNKGTSGLEHGLDLFNMKNYFEIALSKTDVVMKKPHPEGLYKVMEHFDAKPEEVLFIGDSIHDIECGQNAGVDTILVAWTVMDLEKLKKENPTYIVNTPEEIIDIAKNNKTPD